MNSHINTGTMHTLNNAALRLSRRSSNGSKTQFDAFAALSRANADQAGSVDEIAHGTGRVVGGTEDSGYYSGLKNTPPVQTTFGLPKLDQEGGKLESRRQDHNNIVMIHKRKMVSRAGNDGAQGKMQRQKVPNDVLIKNLKSDSPTDMEGSNKFQKYQEGVESSHQHSKASYDKQMKMKIQWSSQ